MKEIRVGTENDRDCIVHITESDDLDIKIDTKVETCREDIERIVIERVKAYGIERGRISISERGALDYVIRARVDYALSLFTGSVLEEEGFKRKQTGRDIPRRSRLYVPGNNPRLLINAGIFGSDCVILDLEDSVPVDQKGAARHLVKEALKNLDFGNSEVWVRVNKEFLEEDIRFVLLGAPHGIALPKSERKKDIAEVVEILEKYERRYHLEKTKLMPIVESAKGIINLEDIIGESERIVAVAFGAEDFTRDIGAEKGWDSLLYARSKIVTVAKAYGIQALDTVYSDVNDLDGLIEETKRIARMGFDGKGAIHPEQIEPINSCFTPTEEEIEYAKRVIKAIEDARRKGIGAVSLDGKMIDEPVVKRAERILRLGGIL